MYAVFFNHALQCHVANRHSLPFKCEHAELSHVACWKCCFQFFSRLIELGLSRPTTGADSMGHIPTPPLLQVGHCAVYRRTANKKLTELY